MSLDHGRERLAAIPGLVFQLTRIFFLTMIISLPLAGVTAVREIALSGAAGLLAVHLYLYRPGLRSTVIWAPLAAYVLCAGLSLITAADFFYSLKEFRGEILKGVLVYYTAVHFVWDWRHVRQTWMALLAVTAMMAGAGLWIFLAQGGSFLYHGLRASSLHYGYQPFATFLVLTWPFLLMAFKVWRKPPVRVFLWALLAVTLASAYATYSRAAWAAMVVGFFLFSCLVGRRRLKVAAAAALVCLVLVSVLALVPGARHGEQWENIWNDPGEVGGTAGDLVDVWCFSLEKLKEHPFRGIGVGRHSFSKAFPEFRVTHQPLLWHAHNMFVDTALQMGLQGLIALIVLLAMILAALWSHEPPDENDLAAHFRLAAFIMVVIFCLRNLTDDFFTDDSALFFWAVTGVAIGSKYLNKESNAPQREA